jgi:peptidoglycan/LPS O-acetylase OafA/YrhL
MSTLIAEAERPATAQLWVVEAWRAVAALLVLWAHWGVPLGWAGVGPQGWLRFAFTGVDLFFVLSGFVFAPLLLQRPAPSMRAFALRRVARIYPAYLAALALYVLLAWQAGRPVLHITEHLLMGHLQSREMAFYYNPAFWSLPVEVAFYAALPLLAVWLAQGRIGTEGEGFGQGLRWPLLLGLALLLRLALLAGADGAAQNPAYILLNHLPGLLVEFLLGVWVWQQAQQPLSRAGAWAWGLAGLVGWCGLAAVFVQLPASVQAWPGGQLALGAALCFALMLRATLLLPSGGVGVQALARWGGRLSYSVYLLHTAWLAPALVWTARWGAGAGSVLALAALLMSCLALYWAVEEPARRWGRALARRWERADMGRLGLRAGSADRLGP